MPATSTRLYSSIAASSSCRSRLSSCPWSRVTTRAGYVSAPPLLGTVRTGEAAASFRLVSLLGTRWWVASLRFRPSLVCASARKNEAPREGSRRRFAGSCWRRRRNSDAASTVAVALGPAAEPSFRQTHLVGAYVCSTRFPCEVGNGWVWLRGPGWVRSEAEKFGEGKADCSGVRTAYPKIGVGARHAHCRQPLRAKPIPTSVDAPGS